MSAGRCLCGAVAYRVDGPLRPVIVCHCVDCRRWHGRAAAMTCAPRQSLAITGEEALRWFRLPDGPERGWCGRCGSSLFWTAPGRDTVSIAAGTLDDPRELRVVAHIWWEHAEPWEAEQPGDVPHHPRGAPPALAAPPQR
ncbi:GFA family protein [Actinomycetospora cinnamomea]|uniref:CENP-V/GFA domain-containing protein n=1 Tax=Actinomycetospora cinnamomea TaxID=663609 RepID=A0A2U1F445_9PSEU|nr:GFA family protein [Actinomycetospora cinnamomea]PVZ06955.1 hypothetical protein C8D89_112148 [Actinomycetospora cinnamomea]